jgi:hypothetical protein
MCLNELILNLKKQKNSVCHYLLINRLVIKIRKNPKLSNRHQIEKFCPLF